MAHHISWVRKRNSEMFSRSPRPPFAPQSSKIGAQWIELEGNIGKRRRDDECEGDVHHGFCCRCYLQLFNQSNETPSRRNLFLQIGVLRILSSVGRIKRRRSLEHDMSDVFHSPAPSVQKHSNNSCCRAFMYYTYTYTKYIRISTPQQPCTHTSALGTSV